MPVYKSKTPTKDGRQWQFQVSQKQLDGTYKNYRSKLYATKKEAEKQEAIFLLERKVVKNNELLSFDDVIPNFLKEKQATTKPQTYDREVVMCRHVSNFIGKVVISKLTADQYELFRERVLATDYSISYKNKINKQLKSIIKFAERKYDIVNTIPQKYKAFVDTSPKKEMQIFTLEEFEQFIAVADNDIYKAYFTTLMFTGMRMNEANALQWADINFDKGIISVNKSVVFKTKSKDSLYLITTPKTKASIRNIPMAKRVLNSLKTLYSEQLLNKDFSNEWFCFGGERPLPETTITSTKDRWIKKAGVHRIRVHDFRHSFTSMLVNNLGVDNIVLISKMLGHSSIEETLSTYSHLWNNAYDKLIDKLNSIT